MLNIYHYFCTFSVYLHELGCAVWRFKVIYLIEVNSLTYLSMELKLGYLHCQCFVSMYNFFVMLNLTPLPEMILTSLVELCTWFYCLVLWRNQKIHSLLIKYHGLILLSTMEICFLKKRECQSSFVLRLEYHLVHVQRSCTWVGMYWTYGIYVIYGIHGQGFMWMTMVDIQMMDCTGIHVESLDSIFCKTTFVTNYRIFMTHKITSMVYILMKRKYLIWMIFIT